MGVVILLVREIQFELCLFLYCSSCFFALGGGGVGFFFCWVLLVFCFVGVWVVFPWRSVRDLVE